MHTILRSLASTLTALMAVAMMTGVAAAQEPRIVTEGFSRPTSLFDAPIVSGAYAAPTLKFTRMHDAPSLLVGARGGWILNHRLVLGAAVYGGAMTDTEGVVGNVDDVAVDYFGLILELSLFPEQAVHTSLDVLFGIGDLQQTAARRAEDGTVYHAPDDTFLVTEIGFNVVVNLARHVHVAVGPSYRFASGVNMAGMSDLDLGGVALTTSLQFGVF